MILSGIVHCHSELSYDCRTPLETLREFFVRQGFRFVAMTDHDRGVTPEAFGDFVGRCAALSDDRFLFVPGIEVRCPDGIEIAAVGVSRLPEPGPPAEVVGRIRELGGFAIWVHPRKRNRPLVEVHDCDAIEVLNGKLDGTFAPDPEIVRLVRRERARGRPALAIFGLDMHDDLQLRSAWVECEAEALGIEPILDAFRRGRFVNRTRWGSVASTGATRPVDRARLATIRAAYRGWDRLLGGLPGAPRRAVVRISRPLVRFLKPQAK